MRFATIARVNPDSTVELRYADGDESEAVATLNGYRPVQFEQVIVTQVEGEDVVLGSVYNRAMDLDTNGS